MPGRQFWHAMRLSKNFRSIGFFFLNKKNHWKLKSLILKQNEEKVRQEKSFKPRFFYILKKSIFKKINILKSRDYLGNPNNIQKNTCIWRATQKEVRFVGFFSKTRAIDSVLATWPADLATTKVSYHINQILKETFFGRVFRSHQEVNVEPPGQNTSFPRSKKTMEFCTII